MDKQINSELKEIEKLKAQVNNLIIDFKIFEKYIGIDIDEIKKMLYNKILIEDKN